MKRRSGGFFAAWAGSLAFAVGAGAFADPASEASLKEQLRGIFPGHQEVRFRPSPLPGIQEIEMDGQIFYLSDDGKYLFAGNLFDTTQKANLTEAKRQQARVHALDAMGESNMIVMGPSSPKRFMTVFTDVDCAYCAKLHQEAAPRLTKAGVKIRYVLYPRNGLQSDTYKKSVSVWCSKDRVKAIGIAKSGGAVESKTCANPVEKGHALGERLGVEGTPFSILDDGRVVNGYVPADRLLAMLGITEADRAK